VYWFSRKQRVLQGALVRENEIVFRHDREEERYESQEIPLAGAHNVENVLAPWRRRVSLAPEPAAIAKGVRSFAGVEHRLEFCRGGRRRALLQRLKGHQRRCHAESTGCFSRANPDRSGGKDKGSDYTVLQRPLREKAILAC